MMMTILHLAAAPNPWGVPWDSVDRRFGESSDKWMLWMVTLIYLSVAPKAWVGPRYPTLYQPTTVFTCTVLILYCTNLKGREGGQKFFSRKEPLMIS